MPFVPSGHIVLGILDEDHLIDDIPCIPAQRSPQYSQPETPLDVPQMFHTDSIGNFKNYPAFWLDSTTDLTSSCDDSIIPELEASLHQGPVKLFEMFEAPISQSDGNLCEVNEQNPRDESLAFCSLSYVPPLHGRSLYSAIPLPPDDETEDLIIELDTISLEAGISALSTSEYEYMKLTPREDATVLSACAPVTLFDNQVLQSLPKIDWVSCYTLLDTARSYSTARSTGSDHDQLKDNLETLWRQALTQPPVEVLTLLLRHPRQLVHVVASGDQVTVGDLLSTLNVECASYLNGSCEICHDGCQCQRMEVVLDSLEIWRGQSDE